MTATTPTPESLSAAAAYLLRQARDAEMAEDDDARQLREHYEAVTQAADWFAARQREEQGPAVSALRPLETRPGRTYRAIDCPGHTYRRTGYVLRCHKTGTKYDVDGLPDEPTFVPAA